MLSNTYNDSSEEDSREGWKVGTDEEGDEKESMKENWQGRGRVESKKRAAIFQSAEEETEIKLVKWQQHVTAIIYRRQNEQFDSTSRSKQDEKKEGLTGK